MRMDFDSYIRIDSYSQIMKNLVFLPGLGADKRLFEFVRIDNCIPHYIHWIKPGRDEGLRSYVEKIKEQVSSIEQPVLIGVSMGGIVAMELRELMPVSKTILISSIKNMAEKPAYFNWVKKTHLNDLIPPAFLKKSAPFIKPFYSHAGKDDAFKLFMQMAFDADEDFIEWGIRKVLDWDKSAYDK